MAINYPALMNVLVLTLFSIAIFLAPILWIELRFLNKLDAKKTPTREIKILGKGYHIFFSLMAISALAAFYFYAENMVTACMLLSTIFMLSLGECFYFSGRMFVISRKYGEATIL